MTERCIARTELSQFRRWLRDQNTKSTACHPGQFPVRTAGQNHWDFGSDHNACCQRSSKVLKFLEKDISGLEIGNHQKIDVSRDRRIDVLDASGIA